MTLVSSYEPPAHTVSLSPVSAKHWLTELEVMASLFAAAIHDYEHTGTTNNFHIHTK